MGGAATTAAAAAPPPFKPALITTRVIEGGKYVNQNTAKQQLANVAKRGKLQMRPYMYHVTTDTGGKPLRDPSSFIRDTDTIDAKVPALSLLRHLCLPQL